MLEGAFGDAELLVNFLSRAFISERPEAAAGDEFSHDLFFEIIDALPAGRLEESSKTSLRGWREVPC